MEETLTSFLQQEGEVSHEKDWKNRHCGKNFLLVLMIDFSAILRGFFILCGYLVNLALVDPARPRRVGYHLANALLDEGAPIQLQNLSHLVTETIGYPLILIKPPLDVHLMTHFPHRYGPDDDDSGSKRLHQ